MTIYSVFAFNQDDEVISLYFGTSLDQARYEYDFYNRSKETRGLKEIHLSQTIKV
jgi:hypothetical protein